MAFLSLFDGSVLVSLRWGQIGSLEFEVFFASHLYVTPFRMFRNVRQARVCCVGSDRHVYAHKPHTFIMPFKSTPSLLHPHQVLRTVSSIFLRRMMVLPDPSSSGVSAFSTSRPRGPALTARGFLQTQGASPLPHSSSPSSC